MTPSEGRVMDPSDDALRALCTAAKRYAHAAEHAGQRPRARALDDLVQVARVFSKATDLEWATELAAAKEALVTCRRSLRNYEKTDLGGWNSDVLQALEEAYRVLED